MNESQFILVIALILFIAFCFGWFVSWVLHRFSKVTTSDIAELEDMSQKLHDAEELRDQAISYAQHREAELSNQLTQTEAELAAIREGLRASRQEASELRGYIESINQG